VYNGLIKSITGDELMKTILGGLLLMLYSLCGYTADNKTMSVDSSRSKFVVSLPSNPTTGYQWKLITYDKKLLKLIKSQYVPPQTKLIGAGGNMAFTFARVKGQSYPKSTYITLTYGRSWEPKNGTVTKMTINFVKGTR